MKYFMCVTGRTASREERREKVTCVKIIWIDGCIVPPSADQFHFKTYKNEDCWFKIPGFYALLLLLLTASKLNSSGIGINVRPLTSIPAVSEVTPPLEFL